MTESTIITLINFTNNNKLLIDTNKVDTPVACPKKEKQIKQIQYEYILQGSIAVEYIYLHNAIYDGSRQPVIIPTSSWLLHSCHSYQDMHQSNKGKRT